VQTTIFNNKTIGYEMKNHHNTPIFQNSSIQHITKKGRHLATFFSY